jgi:hypothetical protein
MYTLYAGAVGMLLHIIFATYFVKTKLENNIVLAPTKQAILSIKLTNQQSKKKY